MKINNIADLVLSIVLIVCLVLFGISLIKEITIMNKLKYPGNCIQVNEEYYCKQKENAKVDTENEDKEIRM